MLRYLELEDGEKELKFADLKLNTGRMVRYLRNCDIDKSGRGYFFPRYGVIHGVYRNNALIGGNEIYKTDLREIVLMAEQPK